MIIFDSNIWIAYSYDDDSLHDKARNIVENNTSHILLPEYILCAVSTVLLQKAGKDTALRFIDRMTNNSDITILYSSPAFVDATIKMFSSKNDDEHLPFIDTSLLYLSMSYKIISFDRHLNRAIKARQ